MRIGLLICLMSAILLALSAALQAPDPTVAATRESSAFAHVQPTLQIRSDLTNLFSNHRAGDSVTVGTYRVELVTVSWQSDSLQAQVRVENNSDRDIDISSAFRLVEQFGGTFLPLTTDVPTAAQHDSQVIQLTYTIKPNSPARASLLADWRLMFAPRGWSGPLVFFILK